jgi:hypothetical protein
MLHSASRGQAALEDDVEEDGVERTKSSHNPLYNTTGDKGSNATDIIQPSDVAMSNVEGRKIKRASFLSSPSMIESDEEDVTDL